VAWHLGRLGVGPRDRVGVMMKNCLEWILIDLAALRLGAVVGGFEAGRFNADEIIPRYGLKLLFVDAADGANPRIFDRNHVATYAADTCEWQGGMFGGYGAGDICAIKFTSGSTGEPKGLEATAGSINDSITSVQGMFSHSHGDNILVFLRLALLQQRYWIYSALAYGHDVTLAETDDALGMAQAVGPTVVMGVPGFFEGVNTT
jgi:long-chain acyl-CoA synthetase